MRQRKHHRDDKRQKGQFMTPDALARQIVSRLDLSGCRQILEPSCGEGAFLSAVARKVKQQSGRRMSPTSAELIGIEVDSEVAGRARERMQRQVADDDPAVRVTVRRGDFFRALLPAGLMPDDRDRPCHLAPGSFDLVVGNPPFGGTFDSSLEDWLDRRLGKRGGLKIKKETYAFFIVAAVDLLRNGGRLVFICSDSLLTISTMAGLRRFLMDHGETRLREIDEFSGETSYPMVVLEFVKSKRVGLVARNGVPMSRTAIRRTPHASWGISPDLEELFHGGFLGDMFVASSGMTTGNNDLFVRADDGSGRIEEPYRFEFYDGKVTLAYELERARLGRLSARRRAALEAAESRGDVESRLRVVRRETPLVVSLPDPRYRPYNKANGRLVFSHPTHWIYWESDGEAVLTYKRTGNWYLRGVGGQPYFGREGLTWQLVGSRFTARYLPEGYILDSGAPCAFLREGVRRVELLFVLAWLLSPLAKRVLKTVINHTRNIQSKDFERMPYPWWVSHEDRSAIVATVRGMIAEARDGRKWSWSDHRIRELGARFEMRREARNEAIVKTQAPIRKPPSLRPRSEETAVSLFT